jgi:hypothetical protein
MKHANKAGQVAACAKFQRHTSLGACTMRKQTHLCVAAHVVCVSCKGQLQPLRCSECLQAPLATPAVAC